MYSEETAVEGPRISFATLTILAVIVLGLSAISSNVGANESVALENTAPDSAVESVTPIGEALTVPEVKEPVRIKWLSRRVEDLPPILRDATFKINFRAYRFDRETVSDRRDLANALGGEIFFETGKFLHSARVGLSYYSSNLFGNSENAGLTGLVSPDGDDLNVLGQAYFQFGDSDGWHASLYRRSVTVPYLDPDDSRMIPRTHEAYFVRHLGERRDFGFGHITRTKLKNSESFIPMSEAAGAPGTDKGVSVAGAKVDILENTTLGLFNLYGWDTYNTLYTEGNWSSYFLRTLGTKVGVQYTDQRSVGDELAGDFRTYAIDAQLAMSYRNALLTLAFTTTDEGGETQNPFGGHPSPISLMIEDFNRAGEDAWLAGVTYDFSRIGLDGLSAFGRYAHGNTPDSGALASPDQDEVDFTVDYRFKKGLLKGLWLRLRGAYLDQKGPEARDVTNIRMILNYDFQIL